MDSVKETIKEEENLAEPVHILVLVCVERASVFGPCDRGFGDACGLTGQSGLNVYRHRDISWTLSD